MDQRICAIWEKRHARELTQWLGFVQVDQDAGNRKSALYLATQALPGEVRGSDYWSSFSVLYQTLEDFALHLIKVRPYLPRDMNWTHRYHGSSKSPTPVDEKNTFITSVQPDEAD